MSVKRIAGDVFECGDRISVKIHVHDLIFAVRVRYVIGRSCEHSPLSVFEQEFSSCSQSRAQTATRRGIWLPRSLLAVVLLQAPISCLSSFHGNIFATTARRGIWLPISLLAVVLLQTQTYSQRFVPQQHICNRNTTRHLVTEIVTCCCSTPLCFSFHNNIFSTFYVEVEANEISKLTERVNSLSR